MHEDHSSEVDFGERYFLNMRILAVAGIGIVVLAIVGFLFFLIGSPPPTTTRTNSPVQANESGIETARQTLARQTDLNACRSALQQINSAMGEKSAMRPPALTKEQKDWLRANLPLSAEEWSEIESSHYTRLDHQHLFHCFLMRDAVSALEIKGVRSKAGEPAVREKPLDQAVRIFAWVMREVRLRPEQEETAPPSFVVRRGWGTALERALIFLAMLEQVGEPDAPQSELLGFLLQVPFSERGKEGEGDLRLWTCGVVIGDSKEVYLFDPYLGLPLPGPNGKGVATLAQVREQPEILAQLNVSKEYRYPVTKEQVWAAQAQLICPLSALAPRMRFLQDKLLGPAVRVRLASDAAKDMERIQAACSAGPVLPPIPAARKGDKRRVQIPKDKCTLLRRFLPVDEGGADTTSREQRFHLALVPWNALPAVFQDERLFPKQSALGQQVLALFANPFIAPTMEPGQPRDLLLRGRYGSAVEKLVSERDVWRRTLEQRANMSDWQEQFQAWLNEATRVYANLVRAKSSAEREQAEKQVQKLWGERSSFPVRILLHSAAAAVRTPEVAYQLGLCSHEQAEQLQARLDLQAQAGLTPHPMDVEKAHSAWQNAVEKWKSFEEDYPTHLDKAAARRLRGWAEAKLGEHQAAIASWKNVSDCPTELEKLASLYLAQQWEKQHGNKEK